jgi:hypothetical protein
MRVRALFFAAAVFLCASITVAIAQEASIYGVFCETPEQAEMYILEQQQGNSPQDTFEEVLKQDKKYNCMKLHVTAVGIHQVGKLHTFLEKTCLYSHCYKVGSCGVDHWGSAENLTINNSSIIRAAAVVSQ